MASQAQLLANRQNAQHSTGPLSSEGKARSAQNARKHGLTARELIVRDDEQEAFASLEADLAAQLRPQGALEELVFNQLFHAAWNQRRIHRLEAELFDGQTDPLANPAHTETLDRYARYQARFDRAFHRALRELRSLQAERAQRASLPLPLARVMPPLASVMQLAKRTQDPRTEDGFNTVMCEIYDNQTAVDALHRGDSTRTGAPHTSTAQK